MKHAFVIIIFLLICGLGYSQPDTISYNIYQNNGNLGIGTNNPSNFIELKLVETGSLFEKGFEITRNSGFLRLINGTALNDDFQPRISGLADSDLSPGLTLVGTPSVTDGSARGVLLRGGEYYPMQKGNVLEVDNYTNTLMAVNVKGDLGVGFDKPQARVHVHDGDIYIDNIEKGIIMKSPDGNCWRGMLDNSGNLTFTEIDCPGTFVVKVQESEALNQLHMFPNPTSKNISIRIENSSLKNIRYSIYDINGRLIQQGKIKTNDGVIDLSSIDPGVYLIKVNNKYGRLIAANKVVKN